jgi:phenylpyruvate tautomerase PptA (4-oxalocrotonate tautomerase family)
VFIQRIKTYDFDYGQSTITKQAHHCEAGPQSKSPPAEDDQTDKENPMPTYVCSADTGRLTSDQKAEIVRSITAIHHEETGAPRYLVQVIFYDVVPGNHFIAGRPAPADQIWIRADIRGGRTNEQKGRMLQRIMQDVGKASGAAADRVWVYLSDIPAENIAEYGQMLPPPGSEDAWFSTLPGALKERLRSLA